MTISMMLIISWKLLLHEKRKKEKMYATKYISRKLSWSSLWTKPATLSSELPQPHSNFSLQLIPSRCSKKRFEHLFVSTAIQMYSASCHSGCSVSLPTRASTQALTLTVSDCFSLLLHLPCSLNPPYPTSSDLQSPVHISPCIVLYRGRNIISLMSSHNVHKLLPCVIIIRSDRQRSFWNSYFLF